MAVIDSSDDSLVITVVYDGPPEAGKTTSLRSLARSLGRDVETPAEEDGRTVYFDCMNYTAGRFDGCPIKCRVLSVPGQAHWVERRNEIVAGADVVLFVGDTTTQRWPDALAHLARLRAELDARSGSPIGLVFQANKRDLADVVDMKTIRKAVGMTGIAVVESVAEDGHGIREGFVLAVRLALDHVRAEQSAGRLKHSAPDWEGAEELLQKLRGVRHRPTRRDLPTVSRRDLAPRSPSYDAPSGSIWPPVTGRVLLHDAAALGLRSRVSSNGDCFAGLGVGFRLHSARTALYANADEGQPALMRWAQKHQLAEEILSSRRCIVLCDVGDGRQRLWQIVRALPTLREQFSDAEHSITTAGERLADIARGLVELQRLAARSSVRLPCNVDTVAETQDQGFRFVGLMPIGDYDAAPIVDVEAIAASVASLVQDWPLPDRLPVLRSFRSCADFDGSEAVAMGLDRHLGC